MNKQEWDEIKNSPLLSMKVLYEYWVENEKPGYADISYEMFEGMFEAFMDQYEHKPILTPDGVKMIRKENITKKVFDYFNNKFAE